MQKDSPVIELGIEETGMFIGAEVLFNMLEVKELSIFILRDNSSMILVAKTR